MAVDLGDLRRTTPINANWGRGRGTPIDRVYIERFLDRHRRDVRGRVLEASDSDYALRFGSELDQVDVLDVSSDNIKATVVADLQDAPQIPDGSFDCVILTQVLQYVYDVRAAMRTLHRILSPGGVVLATVPGITRLSTAEAELWGEWWRFTAASARKLAEEVFGSGNVEVETYGNVLVAASFLYGLSSRDLSSAELAAHDPAYEVTIAVRALKVMPPPSPR